MTTVIKVGGSLAESAAARLLMQRLTAQRLRRVIIVPGGGDFADAVRKAQALHGFDERTAHHMALVAMQMSAIMLAGFAPEFEVAETTEEFAAAWQRAHTPIWAPARMALAARDVAASWDVTSDSLAAWLADAIGATRLVLVKSCSIPPAIAADAEALARAGIVDRSFTRFVAGRRFAWRVVADAHSALAAVSDSLDPVRS
jgi:5-(aminomethyl)-3-furanmethanol phosphate kinase